MSEVVSGIDSTAGITVGSNNPNLWKRVYFPTNANSQAATAAGVMANIGACTSLPPSTTAQGGVRGDWFYAYPLYINYGGYNHMSGPNTRSCSTSFAPGWDTWGLDAYGMAPPTSNHPGGVNALLSDGSVKFMKDSIGLPTWWALGTRNGNEVISSDSY